MMPQLQLVPKKVELRKIAIVAESGLKVLMRPISALNAKVGHCFAVAGRKWRREDSMKLDCCLWQTSALTALAHSRTVVSICPGSLLGPLLSDPLDCECEGSYQYLLRSLASW